MVMAWPKRLYRFTNIPEPSASPPPHATVKFPAESIAICGYRWRPAVTSLTTNSSPSGAPLAPWKRRARMSWLPDPVGAPCQTTTKFPARSQATPP